MRSPRSLRPFVTFLLLAFVVTIFWLSVLGRHVKVRLWYPRKLASVCIGRSQLRPPRVYVRDVLPPESAPQMILRMRAPTGHMWLVGAAALPACSGVTTDREWTRPLPLIQNGYSTNFSSGHRPNLWSWCLHTTSKLHFVFAVSTPAVCIHPSDWVLFCCDSLYLPRGKKDRLCQ